MPEDAAQVRCVAENLPEPTWRGFTACRILYYIFTKNFREVRVQDPAAWAPDAAPELTPVSAPRHHHRAGVPDSGAEGGPCVATPWRSGPPGLWATTASSALLSRSLHVWLPREPSLQTGSARLRSGNDQSVCKLSSTPPRPRAALSPPYLCARPHLDPPLSAAPALPSLCCSLLVAAWNPPPTSSTLSSPLHPKPPASPTLEAEPLEAERPDRPRLSSCGLSDRALRPREGSDEFRACRQARRQPQKGCPLPERGVFASVRKGRRARWAKDTPLYPRPESSRLLGLEAGDVLSVPAVPRVPPRPEAPPP